MRQILQNYINELKKNRTKRRHLATVLCMLCLIVGTAVIWQLRITGITMSDVPCCGKEEHHHTDECYGDPVLICGKEEGERELICGKPEHHHTEDCYETVRELTCGMQEHTHDESCYEMRKVLVCTKDHEHTEDCYEMQKVLVCTIPEHHHTDACYTEKKVLTCGLEEHEHTDACYGEPHVHTEECYTRPLICGMEEHEHTIACYADPKADVETAADWEKTLPDELTGKWAEDVLKVAQSQMGYQESTQNFILAEDGTTQKGYSRYGAWYGSPYADWSTSFVSFCLRYADIPEEAVPRMNGAFALASEMDKMGTYFPADSGYVPLPGDIVFLKLNDASQTNAAAIVTGLGSVGEEPALTVIEGDFEDQVADTVHLLNSEESDEIVGYGSLKASYERAEREHLLDEPEENENENPAVETTAPTVENEEAQQPEAAPEISAELNDLMSRFALKAEEYKNADEAEAGRSIKLELDQLYSQAEDLFLKQNENTADADFRKFAESTQPNAMAAYAEAAEKFPETMTDDEAKDAMLAKRLAAFDETAKEFTSMQELGKEKEAKDLKLQLDQLYSELQNLYAARYPDAEEGAFETYLNTTCPKGAERYLEAVKAFPETGENVIVYSDPVPGKVQDSLSLSTMDLDVTVSGYAMFPEKEVQANPEEDIPALEETMNPGETAAPENETTGETEASTETTVPEDTTEATTEATVPEETAAATTEATVPEETAAATEATVPEETAAATTEATVPEETEEAAKPADKTPAEETAVPDTRWDDVEIQMDPLQADDLEAFMNYIAENHPDAYSATAVDLQVLYQQNDLDLTDFQVNMEIKLNDPSQLKQNEYPISLFAAYDAPENQADEGGYVLPMPEKQTENETESSPADEDPLQKITVVQCRNGVIVPVASETVPLSQLDGYLMKVGLTDQPEDQEPAPDNNNGVECCAAPALLNAPAGSNKTKTGVILERAAKKAGDVKPIDGSNAYPNNWFMLTGDDLNILNDPYFITKAEEDADKGPDEVYKFEKPSATLGYVLRNYNIFTLEDAEVAHVVGASAVGGNAYYDTNQGGTGAGGDAYRVIPNYAPTYINGFFYHFSKSDGFVETGAPNVVNTNEGQQINYNNADRIHFPTYIGSCNARKAVSGYENTEIGGFDDAYFEKLRGDSFKPEWLKGAFEFTDTLNPKYSDAPMYYADHYIDFNQFFSQFEEKLPEIPRKYTVADPNSAAGKNATMEHDGYEWLHKEDHNVLFVKMGHHYTVNCLDNTEIVLVPPAGFDYGEYNVTGTGAARQSDADTKMYGRMDMLATARIHTIIYSEQKNPTFFDGSHAAIGYYYKDLVENPFLTDGSYGYATLAGVKDYVNSCLFCFPEAETFKTGQFIGHIIAPKANVIQPHTGDSYGCVIAKSAHIKGDLHMLPYGGEGKIKYPDSKLSKMILEDGNLREPDDDEVFEFVIEPYGYYHLKADKGYAKKQNFPHLTDLTSNDLKFTVNNFRSKIDIKIQTDEISEYFSNLNDKYISASNYSEFKGKYVFKITEKPKDKYECDPSVYYLVTDFTHDPVWTGGYANQPPLVPNGFKDNFDSDGNKVQYITFTNTKIKGIPELPHTGGIGVLPFVGAGLAFTSIPITMSLKKKKTHRKGRR